MTQAPDIDKLKAEWADLSRKIEEITGEKPKEQEPQKPVCANCKWKDSNGMSHTPYYWLCNHRELGLYSETYCPTDGRTTYIYRYCRDVNNGDCSGFEPAPPKRTWNQWINWVLGV